MSDQQETRCPLLDPKWLQRLPSSIQLLSADVRFLDHKGDRVQVVALDPDTDTIVGVGTVESLDKEVATLCYLWVHPDWRSKGIGTAIQAYRAGIARARGCSALSCLVHKGNPIRAHYEKIGWRPCYCYDDGDVMMTMSLQ